MAQLLRALNNHEAQSSDTVIHIAKARLPHPINASNSSSEGSTALI